MLEGLLDVALILQWWWVSADAAVSPLPAPNHADVSLKYCLVRLFCHGVCFYCGNPSRVLAALGWGVGTPQLEALLCLWVNYG